MQTGRLGEELKDFWTVFAGKNKKAEINACSKDWDPRLSILSQWTAWCVHSSEPGTALLSPHEELRARKEAENTECLHMCQMKALEERGF